MNTTSHPAPQRPGVPHTFERFIVRDVPVVAAPKRTPGAGNERSPLAERVCGDRRAWAGL